MLIAHYSHRLPANFDLDLIRNRARERGSLWDATPHLVFKAFLLRERGRAGAASNSYSSLYIWRNEEAFAAFLQDGRFRVVTDSFGRPSIATYTVLDACRGTAQVPRFAFVQDVAIGLDEDLQDRFADEVARNRAQAARAGTIAAAVGVDPRDWRIIRLLLSEQPPDDEGAAYEILHLASPLIAALPQADNQD
jgi:hypothetical protein